MNDKVEAGTGTHINYNNGTSTSQAAYPTNTGQNAQSLFMPSCKIIYPQIMFCTDEKMTSVV